MTSFWSGKEERKEGKKIIQSPIQEIKVYVLEKYAIPTIQSLISFSILLKTSFLFFQLFKFAATICSAASCVTHVEKAWPWSNPFILQ
jgi:hypothetical protein